MAKGKSIFDYAMAQEKDGMTFYNKASRKFKDKEIKKLFLRLAGEEKKHYESFKNLKVEAQKKKIDDKFRAARTNEYLETLLRDGIFPKGDSMSKQIDKINSLADACILAMQAEKNAILLYSELAKTSKNKDQKKIFDELVKEEKGHIGMIGQVRAACDPGYAALTLEGSYNPYLYA